SVCDLPLLVDADTGWGSVLNIARAVKQMIKAGAAGIHLEDQVQAKRCGHLPGKAVVEPAEMVDRLKAALDVRTDNDFLIMARTDAIAVEGIEKAIERAQTYAQAGADVIFVEAVDEISQYQQFSKALSVPILANMTEFGHTPLHHLDELAKVGVGLVLYPLSAFRAMNQAALSAYQTIRELGDQKTILNAMQDRQQLYELLNYKAYEAQLENE
ncbi:MAG: isocitrate lyase/phosphoenolpyruvate mutase family protein, partial [Gammaproteobacteria bacterium]